MDKLRLLWDKRILWAGAVIVLIFLMMDFNHRMSEYLRLSEERDKVGTQVGNLETTKQALQTQIAYATSDVAVEEWARQQGRMVQPGDVPVIPVVPPGPTPIPEVTPAPTQRVPENWEVWQALFFEE